MELPAHSDRAHRPERRPGAWPTDTAAQPEDYRTALRFWLGHPDLRQRDILFVENSSYPPDGLHEIAGSDNPLEKQLEFVAMQCNDFPEKTGHGYAELHGWLAGACQLAVRQVTF